MLATIAFLAFWVLIGLGLFLIAFQGGPRGARRGSLWDSRGGRRAALLLYGAFYLVVGAAIPLAIGIGNADSDVAQAGTSEVRLTEREQEGRELFGQWCANCHTLAAARASGPVGPNLDELRPPAELTLNAIEQGRQSGRGTMPAGLLTGSDAEAVAQFVAAVAGR
jgi:mono/diheme cytochrome c family protein